jgi:predicted RNA-binding protein (TIGR00451 family)
VIPDELRGVYPLVQHERIPMSYSQEIKTYITEFLNKHGSKFKQVQVHPSLNLDIEILQDYDKFNSSKDKIKLDEIHIVNAILDYQFRPGTHAILSDQVIEVERSRKTGILRRFSDSSGILGTFRPSDFIIIPTDSFAHRLYTHISAPQLRVTAMSESIPYISNKKDLLAKFVLEVDPEIRCGEEVLIVDENDSFLSFGKSILSAQEMIAFDRGVAVRVRR